MIDTSFPTIQYRAVASEHVMTTDLGAGLALLDLRDNNYFSLDPVGATVWQALQSPRSKTDLVDQVCAAYEIDEQTCSGDLDILLNELVDASLVEVIAPQTL